MKKQIVSLIGITTLLVSTSQASQEQLAKSISDAHAETIRTSAQLKSTLASLNALTKQSKGNLQPAYQAFVSEIGKTESAAQATRKQVDFMAGDGRRYFADWQNSINGISNESLRKKAQKRLDSVKKSYGKVEESLGQASEKFSPFLSDLSDVQKSLATDVTAGGVKAIRGTVRSANWNYQFVNDSITAAHKEMGKMTKALSSEAQ